MVKVLNKPPLLPILIALGAVLLLGAALAQAPTHIATYAHPTTFPDLDPRSGFSNENVIMANVYETLTFYHPEEGVTPKLATDWQVSEDGLVWIFTLREGVTFHDGAPLTAEAVKASLERIKELGLGAAFILGPIETITAVDEHTVQFELAYPAPLDLILSSGYGAWIISPNAIDRDNAWFNEGNASGTGPYTIRSYTPGSSLVIEAYPDYWGGWTEDQFKTVVFEVVEEPTLREQMIRSGNADFTYQLPYTSYAALENVPELRVDITPSFQGLYGLLNTQKAPLDDVRVRRALVLSFPYETVLNNLYGGLGRRAAGAVPQGLWGSLEAPSVTQDLEAAKELLTEAGYPDGGFDMLYTYAAGDLEEQLVGELWRAELAKLGIDMEIRGLTWEAQWDLAKSDPANAQDVLTMYWWPTYVTPYDFLFNMFHSEEEPLFNLGYYSNPEFDALIDEAASLSGTDREAAADMYRQAQEILNEDAAAVFAIETPDVHVFRSDISGYENNPGYPHVVFWHDLKRQ